MEGAAGVAEGGGVMSDPNFLDAEEFVMVPKALLPYSDAEGWTWTEESVEALRNYLVSGYGSPCIVLGDLFMRNWRDAELTTARKILKILTNAVSREHAQMLIEAEFPQPLGINAGSEETMLCSTVNDPTNWNP